MSLLPPLASVAGQRDLSGAVGRIAQVAAIALPTLTVLMAFTGWFDTLTRRAGHLAIAIPLVFLFFPRTRGERRLTPLDAACAMLAFISFAWIVFDRDRIMWRLVYVEPIPWIDLILGTAAIALVLEATRRTLGWALVILALVFFAYALWGPLMPTLIQHKGVPYTMLIEHLYLVPEGLFNMITGVMATYLLVFLLFGTMLRLAGGEQIFAQLTVESAGGSIGGSAKASVVGSALMGTVTGSTIATVATTGSITIPLMKRTGFLSHEAAAIATASATGGAIMPPVMGVGVFLMAEITGIPLLTILGYSILPALLYFGSIYAYIEVKARKCGMRPLRTGAQRPALWAALMRASYLMVPLGLLIYLLARDYSPFYASAVCVVSLWAVSYLRKESRLNWRKLLLVLELTTRDALVLSATSAIAATVLGIITASGLMLKFTSLTLALAKGSLLAAIGIVAAVSTLLGMGLPVTSAYIVVSTLGAPSLAQLGMTLLGAHLLIFWFAQTATITPPVCMTAFVAAKIAGASPMRTGWEALHVAKGMFLIPLMFAYTNILSGDVVRMVLDALAGLLWLAMFPILLEGYLFGRLGAIGRVVVALAATAFVVSTFTQHLPGTGLALAIGLALVGGLAYYQARQGSQPPQVNVPL
ncbi:MAG: TRAP transporter permease [Vicinamibacterales bacterium]